ncbi:hypothetical protein ACFLIM_26265 [Nonomuraea sp. M3C6]|uniref:t-SNARE coiled-coil homology domain-containing protein n=1 Tax=Nonomuraea marmarensis TaxID=3351344 RepID=A0ABW7AH70_9ACTN
MDLQEKCRELDVRLSALEKATVSGVPGMSIADRINALGDRVGFVGNNILDRIDRAVAELKTEMDGRFAQVDERFAQVDARFDHIDKRLDGHDARFDHIDGEIADIKSILVRIDAKLTDQQPN